MWRFWITWLSLDSVIIGKRKPLDLFTQRSDMIEFLKEKKKIIWSSVFCLLIQETLWPLWQWPRLHERGKSWYITTWMREIQVHIFLSPSSNFQKFLNVTHSPPHTKTVFEVNLLGSQNDMRFYVVFINPT